MRSARIRFQPLMGLGLMAAALIGVGLAARLTAAAESSASKPARKDSPAGIRPREATWSVQLQPDSARAGETVTYRATLKLEPGWHVYNYARDPNAGGPPIKTTFDFYDPAGLEPVGSWTPSREPERKPEPAFENKIVEFFEDEVTFRLELRVPPGAEPGKRTLRCQAGFQICNAQSCKLPVRVPLPEVAVTIQPGGASAATLPPADRQKTSDRTEAVTSTADSSPGPEPAPAPVPSTSPTAGKEKPVSEIARKARLGLVPFLLSSALGGLYALAMPCVWPMVPITVNFFVKQGQRSRKTSGLAVVYCLTIIGIFTGFGVICSFLFSATALQNLANNPWLNTAVALLFLVFGLSLLGVFEIRLPSFLLNASAQGEGRGGLVGVMFMALTLTITSFTCTFPVVGGLIFMASQGEFFYPVIGLTTFSAVLALPFFVLALMPGLLSKLPRSGDWMNAVKVVGGLIEIGAALKFINTAEIGFGSIPEDAWFDAQVVLSAWVVLAAVCGVYLLGLFRTDHDHEEVRIGPGRLIAGTSFLSLALFLAPALFGHPPASKIYYKLVGLLPLDVTELNAPVSGAGSSAANGLADAEGCRAVKAVSSDPKTAEREQKSCHGVQWGMSLEAAQEQARAQNRPILIDFTGVNCANCRTMEIGVMPRPEIAKLLDRFVTVQLYTDFVPIDSISQDQREELAGKNQERLIKLAGEATNPFYVAIDSSGKVLASIGGYRPATVFADFLNQALSKYEGSSKLAQNSMRP